MIYFRQYHQNTVTKACSFNSITQVVDVAVDAVDKYGEIVIHNHVFNSLCIYAVDVRPNKGNFVNIYFLPVYRVQVVEAAKTIRVERFAYLMGTLAYLLPS